MPSFQAALPGKPDQMSPNHAADPVDTNGKLLTVHYGPGKGIRDDLSSRGKRLPDGFRGNGREMAAVMGTSVNDLSRQFGVSVAEFEESRFDVGLSAIPKAGE